MNDPTTDIGTTIETIVADRCAVDQSALDGSTRFDGEVLDADSLDVVEIAEAIDATLGVYIPDEELEELETVGDVCDYVRGAV